MQLETTAMEVLGDELRLAETAMDVAESVLTQMDYDDYDY